MSNPVNFSLESNQVALYYEHSLKQTSPFLKKTGICKTIVAVAKVCINVLKEVYTASRSFTAVKALGGVANLISTSIASMHLVYHLKEWSFDKKKWSKSLKTLSLHIMETTASLFDILGLVYVAKNIGVIKGAVNLGGAALLGTVGSGIWLPVILVSIKDTIEKLHKNIHDKQKLDSSLEELEEEINFLENLFEIEMDESGNFVSYRKKEEVDTTTIDKNKLKLDILKDLLKLNKSERMKHVAALITEVTVAVLCTLAIISFIGGISAISGGVPILLLTVVAVCGNVVKLSLSLRHDSLVKRISQITLQIQNSKG